MWTVRLSPSQLTRGSGGTSDLEELRVSSLGGSGSGRRYTPTTDTFW